MSAVLIKKIYVICFFISLFYLLKLIMLNLLFINKGAFNVHKPVSYINLPIDLKKVGIIQVYNFKNSIKAKYNIEAKIRPSVSAMADKFSGVYRIDILKNDHLVSQIYTSADNSNKDYFKAYLYGDIDGQYYVLGEVILDEISTYTLKIENMKGLLVTNNTSFNLVVSPVKYNIKITKINFLIKLATSLIITISCFVLMNKV